MFLDKLMKRNPQLVDFSMNMVEEGKIEPDSYIVDLDTFQNNAKSILDKAKENGIRLYAMLKQLGRNPFLAQELVNLGYEGVVVVDFKEAQVMMEHNIPIMHAGHLVQIPNCKLENLLDYGVEYITVYSVEMARKINEICIRNGIIQKIMIRVVDEGSFIYSGQEAGIYIDELEEFADKIRDFKRIALKGITVFPAFFYSKTEKKFIATQNINAIIDAKNKLESMGITIEEINLPSGTCEKTMELIKKFGGTSGEPGHGLTGTTPVHAVSDLQEIPCVSYVSEISHSFNGKSFFYGGGYYRRGNLCNAIVGRKKEKYRVITPNLDSIDYYFAIDGIEDIGNPVVTSFRFQIFVTRSNVVIVRGLHTGNPKIIGIYDSQGKEL